MGNVVRYDTDAMTNVANQMRDSIDSFKTNSINKFFEEMSQELGLDPSHKTWNGELAQAYIEKSINPKKAEFDNACNSVISYASNLATQAKSWDTFERGN